MADPQGMNFQAIEDMLRQLLAYAEQDHAEDASEMENPAEEQAMPAPQGPPPGGPMGPPPGAAAPDPRQMALAQMMAQQKGR